MYFSWYSGDFTTDPNVAEDATPEERANPSMASWGNDGYLAQQKKRLPTHKYRRLHLNMPGAPEGAAFDADSVMGAVISGRKRLPREEMTRYAGFVDMSGGSADDSVLAIAHHDRTRKLTVLDSIMAQAGAPPFNPRDAVRKFAQELKAYGLSTVSGDAYAGETFRRDFAEHGITYTPCRVFKSASDGYAKASRRLQRARLPRRAPALASRARRACRRRQAANPNPSRVKDLIRRIGGAA